ncbi:uncharacterized protein LOC100892584 [Strongylocentrotus purpuratus]|uniref:Reverse transcriptase domain-containing protein n=1 Tax=Strongylocentrotus purpuratus TaxID=7668 RepID=A0A7M7T0Q5_STRPU|nr:uncharacterized protein LOC100892584 [Strongylocentrotus purpuratus]
MYFYLNSTSFKWRDNYYQQLQGAAMGSPLSPVIANIFMEHFETTALQTLSQRPSLWLRYVDDTFVIWPHSRRDLDHFLAHINQHHPIIKFTMETEQNNSIPFPDVLFTKSQSGKPTHQVYKTHTHTDIYLHYRSFHHIFVLQSVPNAFIHRAHQLSDADHLVQEIQHVTTALTSIKKYPRHKIKSKAPANSTYPSSIRHPSSTQFLQQTPFDTPLPHRQASKPQESWSLQNTMRMWKSPHWRTLETRLKEHRTSFRFSDWDKSAIVKHAQQHEHAIEWDNNHLISIMKHWHTRRIQEAIEIHRHNTEPRMYTSTTSGNLSSTSTWSPPPAEPSKQPPASQLLCTADDSRLQRRLRRGTHTQPLADSTPHFWFRNST